MNTEVYMYSVFTTVLGMLIVFIFLGFLSFLMAVLKSLFKEKVIGMETKEPEEEVVETVKEEKKLDWLIAAVTAYLMAEEEELYPHSARDWQPVANEKYDPWVIGGKLLQRWSGV